MQITDPEIIRNDIKLNTEYLPYVIKNVANFLMI
jgi:hypothetical protein